MDKVRELPDLIVQRLRKVGADFKVLRRDTDTVYPWPQLPLYCDQCLGGERLSDYLPFPTDLSASEIVDVMAVYVEEFWSKQKGRRKDVSSWLGTQLGLGRDVCIAYFDPVPRGAQYGDRLHVLRALRVVAALTHYKFSGAIQVGPGVFTTLADGCNFGVFLGCPVIRSAMFAPSLPRSDEDMLGKPDPGFASSYNALRHWVEIECTSADREDLVLALNIARRFGLGDRVIKLLEDVPGRADTEAALKFAWRFQEFELPIDLLRHTLVPEVISIDRFWRMFGRPRNLRHPVGPDWTQRWSEALRTLETELLG